MTCVTIGTVLPSSVGALASARWQIRRAMSAGGVWTVSRVAEHLRPVWEEDLPSTEWLTAIVSDDPVLRQVAPDRWVHLGAAVDDRIFTVVVSPHQRACGIIEVGIHLATPLARYEGWQAIPVRSGSGHGVLHRARGRSGRELLVTCPRVFPPAGAPIGFTPGPEGLVIRAVTPDPRATAHLQRRLHQAVRVYGPATATVVGTAGPEVELAALADDPTLRRVPTAPLTPDHPADDRVMTVE